MPSLTIIQPGFSAVSRGTTHSPAQAGRTYSATHTRVLLRTSDGIHSQWHNPHPPGTWETLWAQSGCQARRRARSHSRVVRIRQRAATRAHTCAHSNQHLSIAGRPTATRSRLLGCAQMSVACTGGVKCWAAVDVRALGMWWSCRWRRRGVRNIWGDM
jgi:hypothetical protein